MDASYRDKLSGTFGRKYINHMKAKILPKWFSSDTSFSISLIDIDRLSKINDIYSRESGDRVIKFLASFLKNNLRDGDIIVRYGDDEFLVFQYGLSKENAHVIWNRLIKELKRRNIFAFELKISIGIASFPDDGEDFNSIWETARAGLLEAKRKGGGRVGIEKVKRVKLLSVQFVDRKEEKNRVIKNVENGLITIIVGDRGGGKTRLVKEALRELEDADVLWAECVSDEHKVSYYPIKGLVKYMLHRYVKDLRIPEAYKIEIGKIVPDMAKEDIGREAYYEENFDRYRLFEGLSLLFLPEDKRRVMVVENMQWIDGDSIEVLKYIIRNRSALQSFVFTFRDEELPHFLEDFIQNVSREQEVSEIRLKPLKNEDVGRVVNLIMGEEVPGLADFVIKKSSGNILYVEELLNSLTEYGYLKFLEDRWYFEEPKVDVSPDGVEHIVKRRFDRLTEGAKSLARLLSVARTGYIDLLVELSGYNEGEVFGLIDEGIKAGLYKESEVDDFVEYRSEFFREVIYNTEINEEKKRSLHERVARWLEKNKFHGMEEELAFHYHMAGVAEKVIKYAQIAGDKTYSSYAFRDSLRYYNWAMEYLKGGSSFEKVKDYATLLLRIAVLYGEIGDFFKGLEAVKDALEIAEHNNILDLKARALNSMGIFLLKTGKNRESVSVIHNSIEFCEANGFKKELIRAYNNLGILHSAIGEYEKSLVSYEKALDVADDDKSYKAKIYNNIGLSYSYMGEYDNAEEYFLKTLAVFENNTIERSYMLAVGNLGLLHSNLARYSSALEYYTKALDIAGKTGDIVTKAHLLNNIGIVYSRLGKFNEARENMEKSLRIAKIIGDRSLEGNIYNNIGISYDAMGEYSRALEFYLKAYDVAEEIGSKRSIIIRSMNIGGIYTVLLEYKEAEKWLKKAYDHANKLNIPEMILFAINAYLSYLYDVKNYGLAKKLMSEGEQLLKNAKPSLKCEFFITRFRLLFSMGDIDGAELLYPIMQKEVENVNLLETDLRFALVMMEYFIKRNMPEKALEYGKLAEGYFKSYYDIAKRAEYFMYKWEIALKRNENDADTWLEKAREAFESIGLSKMFEKIRMDFLNS